MPSPKQKRNHTSSNDDQNKCKRDCFSVARRTPIGDQRWRPLKGFAQPSSGNFHGARLDPCRSRRGWSVVVSGSCIAHLSDVANDRQSRILSLHRRPILSARGEIRLIAAAKESPRALLLYLLALRLSFGARQCAGLLVEDVSPDGARARDAFRLRVHDRRWRDGTTPTEHEVDDETAAAATSYLAWRRDRCMHFRLSLRTVRDGSGTLRCHACREPIEFLKSPLFVGRFGRAVAPQWLREEFRGLRTRLRLPERLHFEDLGRRSRPRPNQRDLGFGLGTHGPVAPLTIRGVDDPDSMSASAEGDGAAHPATATRGLQGQS